MKDTVVGHTDESGVTLPPLHPRCRCAIMYREIDTPRVMRPKPRGLAAGNIDTVTIEGTPPKLIGKLDNMTPVAIKKTLEYYEAQIVNAPIENGIIITAEGEVYHCTGDLNTLDTIVELDKKLYGAYVTHNHPIDSVNEYTFSRLDRDLFNNFNLASLRGVDEYFIYELNRDATFLDLEEEIPLIMEGYSAHRHNVQMARFFKYGYRRWLR